MKGNITKINELTRYRYRELNKRRLLRVNCEGVPLLIQYIYGGDAKLIYLCNGDAYYVQHDKNWVKEYFTDYYNKRYNKNLSVSQLFEGYENLS